MASKSGPAYSIRFKADELAQYRAEAKERGVSLAQHIRDAIKTYLAGGAVNGMSPPDITIAAPSGATVVLYLPTAAPKSWTSGRAAGVGLSDKPLDQTDVTSDGGL